MSSALRRKVKYRVHLRWLYYMTWAELIILLVGSLFLGLALYIYQNSIAMPALVGVMAIAVGSVIYWQNQKVMKPMAFSSVDIYDDSLQVHEPAGSKTVLFSDLDEIQVKVFPLAGGWIALKKNGKVLTRITTSLERSEYIAENLHRSLPQLLSNEVTQDYMKTAIWVDHKWARIQLSLQDWRKQIILNILLPVACWLLFKLILSMKGISLSLGEGLLLIVGIYVFNIAIMTLLEMGKAQHFKKIYEEKLKKGGNEYRVRDMKAEAKLNQQCFLIHVGAWIFILLPMLFI